MCGDGPFVLTATATWCVAMCPAETAAMSDRDIETGVFCNCDAFGRPARLERVDARGEVGQERRLHRRHRLAEQTTADRARVFDSLLGKA